jgi:hypothetical protein
MTVMNEQNNGIIVLYIEAYILDKVK